MPLKIFRADFSSLEEISDFIAKNALLAGLDEKAVYAVQLAVDEACSNIIEHAYRGQEGGKIECICNLDEDGLEIILKDQGEKFNPDEVPELKVGAPLEDLGNRGAGLFLIRKIMDEVHFDTSQPQGTTLIMKKKK
jgi:serine/threonine-protein kinase RsbW